MHINFLKELEKLKIPCVVVLTKSATGDMLKDAKTLAQPSAAVLEVLAADEKFRSGETVLAFGLKELVEATKELVPDGFKTAFAAAQKASFSVKKSAARKAVSAAGVAAGASAAIPVPGGHSASLIAIQTSMMASIDYIFGINPLSSPTVLIRQGAVKMATGGGRWAFGLALAEGAKFVPFLGTAGGAVAGGVIGASVTTAIGHAYIEGLSRYLESGKPVPEGVVADAVVSAIKASLEAAANASQSPAGSPAASSGL